MRETRARVVGNESDGQLDERVKPALLFVQGEIYLLTRGGLMSVRRRFGNVSGFAYVHCQGIWPLYLLRIRYLLSISWDILK
jgi:hypothetical protein